MNTDFSDANGWSLRELYKSLETPGENRLRTAHAALDFKPDLRQTREWF